VGDVDLRSLPSDAALLFAPSEADAQELARVSPWPVAVTPRPNRRGTAGDHLNGPSRGRTLNGAGRHRTRHRGGFRGC
jgi:hypothetical protein